MNDTMSLQEKGYYRQTVGPNYLLVEMTAKLSRVRAVIFFQQECMPSFLQIFVHQISI
jgi:hypothetical protein